MASRLRAVALLGTVIALAVTAGCGTSGASSDPTQSADSVSPTASVNRNAGSASEPFECSEYSPLEEFVVENGFGVGFTWPMGLSVAANSNSGQILVNDSNNLSGASEIEPGQCATRGRYMYVTFDVGDRFVYFEVNNPILGDLDVSAGTSTDDLEDLLEETDLTMDGQRSVAFSYRGVRYAATLHQQEPSAVVYLTAVKGRTIANVASGQCLDRVQEKGIYGTKVITWQCHKGLNQEWSLSTRPNERGTIRSMDDNAIMKEWCLTPMTTTKSIDGQFVHVEAKAGDKVWMNACRERGQQANWTTSFTSNAQRIQLKGTNLCIDSSANGPVLQVCNDSRSQLWKITAS